MVWSVAFKKADAPIDLFVSDAQKPKYGRIQDSILNCIRKGEWTPGDRIPPERELARIFDASVGTVRNALRNLVTQGYLSREQGRGTFVRKSIEHSDALRYFRFVGGFDDQVPALTIKCLHPPRLISEPDIAVKLGRVLDDEVFEIHRQFLLGAQPLVYVTSYLPRGLFADFGKFSPQDLEESPIYRLVENEYSMPTLATRELFGAAAATAEVANMLQIESGAPVQKITMMAITTRNTIYEYQVSYCNTADRLISREFPGLIATAGP